MGILTSQSDFTTISSVMDPLWEEEEEEAGTSGKGGFSTAVQYYYEYY